MVIERRKYVRFQAQDNTFAALRSGFKKVGKVYDISIKNLTFSYLSEPIESDHGPHFSQVDIFLSEENGFYLSHVPCKVVSEIPDPTFRENDILMRYRCSLYFGKLTTNQLEKLEFFIKNYTIELSS